MVVDADVLYGATTRAFLAYLDHHDRVRMHWSPLLIDEMSRALVKTRRLAAEAAHGNASALHRLLPGAEVPTVDVQAVFERAWPGVRDAKDLHVAACAVALLAGTYYPTLPAVHLITRNLKDFAPKRLAALGVVQQHPDAFLLALWDRDPKTMADAFRDFRMDLPSRPEVAVLLEKLNNDGQRRTAIAMARAHETGTADL